MTGSGRVVVLAAVAALVAGCGPGLDPGRAPVNAKRADFCRSWTRLAKVTARTSADDLGDYLNELARFGTPRGIPTAARNGFEYVIDPDHAFSGGAAFANLATSTTAAGQDLAALQLYARGLC